MMDRTKMSSAKLNLYLNKFHFVSLIMDGLIGRSTYVEKGIYLENKVLRKYFNKKKRGLLGCNLSIHKADIKKINGFDERYQAPSIGEDSDVQFRLELLGIKIETLNNIAIQYHLYHELQKRPEKNLELFAQVRKSAQHFTPYGLNKYF